MVRRLWARFKPEGPRDFIRQATARFAGDVHVAFAAEIVLRAVVIDHHARDRVVLDVIAEFAELVEGAGIENDDAIAIGKERNGRGSEVFDEFAAGVEE